MVKTGGKTAYVEGPAIPPLTLELLYSKLAKLVNLSFFKSYLFPILYLFYVEMEIDRRRLDPSCSELMKPLKLEINGYIGKILESYKSSDASVNKKKKAGDQTAEGSGDYQDSQDFFHQ